MVEPTAPTQLLVATFESQLPGPLGTLTSPEWLVSLLKADAPAPFHPDNALRTAVRDMLRQRGYKPTGRGKPASEYLVRAAGEGSLVSINLAVDACNATSLHSGLPISVVDLDRAHAPFHIATATAGQAYVFNAAGQEIDLNGLVCLFDAEGPCGNAVKDAQRTKTNAETQRTLSVIWGSRSHAPRLAEAEHWYHELLQRAGVRVAAVELMQR
ncbi:MAG: phenylalanine--tRNA ligase beta subunit-related protein [Longimicrobiales bacterium]